MDMSKNLYLMYMEQWVGILLGFIVALALIAAYMYRTSNFETVPAPAPAAPVMESLPSLPKDPEPAPLEPAPQPSVPEPPAAPQAPVPEFDTAYDDDKYAEYGAE
jgi:hypothetical protein